MPDITAIVMSPEAGMYQWDGWETLNWVKRFTTVEAYHANRLASLRAVKTPYCAWVDSDDLLPDDSGEQAQRLIKMMEQNNHAIGYTDYTVELADGESHRLSVGEYRPVKHYTEMEYLHHLVVMRAKDAIALAEKIPLGTFWTEYMVFAPLARGGASYLPEVGYHWIKRDQGLHRHPDTVQSQRNSFQWYLRSYPLLLK